MEPYLPCDRAFVFTDSQQLILVTSLKEPVMVEVKFHKSTDPIVMVPLLRIKGILANLNRHTSRIHLPLTPVPAKIEFRRVVFRMINAAMSMELTGPTTQSSLTPTGLRKIAPYWYPYTTMAKGRWLGREMLEVVSTEFRDRSIDYYVSLSAFCLKPPHDQHPPSRPEVCSRIRSDNHQREDCQTRYHNPER